MGPSQGDAHHTTRLNVEDVLDTLLHGTVEVEGLLPYSSNYTLLTWVVHHDTTLRAVYKPQQGERPLWDFPQGTLYRREVAAYLLSEALGFSFVPPTVVRHGPYGPGALQFFIHHDPDIHLLTLKDEGCYEHDILRLAVFDYIINNADRKSGHCLKGLDGRMWAIDHGICFHEDYKLRTVLWDFVGLPIPDDILNAVGHLHRQLRSPNHSVEQALKQLLLKAELHALRQRVARLLRKGVYPGPGPGPNIPWPPV